jgi:hypothetical protein
MLDTVGCLCLISILLSHRSSKTCRLVIHSYILIMLFFTMIFYFKLCDPFVYRFVYVISLERLMVET